MLIKAPLYASAEPGCDCPQELLEFCLQGLWGLPIPLSGNVSVACAPHCKQTQGHPPNLPTSDDLPAFLASFIGRNVQLIPQPGHCHLSQCLVPQQGDEQFAGSQQKLGKLRALSRWGGTFVLTQGCTNDGSFSNTCGAHGHTADTLCLSSLCSPLKLSCFCNPFQNLPCHSIK